MSQPRIAVAVILAGLSAAASAQNTSFYVEPGTTSTQRETDPPAYVKNLGDDFAWLDLGIQQRVRYERRDDDLRRFDNASFDDPWFSRTRVYLGVRNLVDPLRFAVEFQDSRIFETQYARSDRDTNHAEFIQGFAELHFDDVLEPDARGNARPLQLRYGRQAFELLDRRLMARNEWRNTTNTFDGVRVSLGQDSNDWQLELMSFHPVTRLLSDTDKADEDVRFNVVVGHWRAWPRLTVEPHYFQLKQDASLANGNRARDIKAPGLRVYGKSPTGAINYEASVMLQHGSDGALDHEAHAYTAEVGYTWLQNPWRPRLGLFYGYATGDESPTDRESNRFERFYGFGRAWSANEYALYENMHAPKLRLDFQPIQGVRVDIGYNAYWLASSRDRFNNLLGATAFNRDGSGNSGDFVGQEVDGRVRFSPSEFLDVAIGYAHFLSEEFVENRQRAALGKAAEDSDFFYAELTFSLF
jgi:hypothetical protein